jgi:hypothetical protein
MAQITLTRPVISRNSTPFVVTQEDLCVFLTGNPGGKTLAMGNFRDTGSIFIASSGEIIASDLFYHPIMSPAGS